jgi:hypothetical protein
MNQRIRGTAIACWAAALSIAACSSAEPVRPAFDPPLARSVNDTSTRAAVAKSGAKVCRQMQVGIAQRDWVRGVVTEISGDSIGVRIEHPGQFPQSLNGTPLVRGALVRDSATAWTPCRF